MLIMTQATHNNYLYSRQNQVPGQGQDKYIKNHQNHAETGSANNTLGLVSYVHTQHFYHFLLFLCFILYSLAHPASRQHQRCYTARQQQIQQ